MSWSIFQPRSSCDSGEGGRDFYLGNFEGLQSTDILKRLSTPIDRHQHIINSTVVYYSEHHLLINVFTLYQNNVEAHFFSFSRHHLSINHSSTNEHVMFMSHDLTSDDTSRSDHRFQFRSMYVSSFLQKSQVK